LNYRGREQRDKEFLPEEGWCEAPGWWEAVNSEQLNRRDAERNRGIRSSRRALGRAVVVW
jgi:hypothetical protein